MTKRIATVDGAKNGVIGCTIALDSRGTPIDGSFGEINIAGQRWLVRIQGVSLTNPIHSNDTFAPFIMTKGGVPEWSGHTDIERAEAEVITILNEKGEHIPRDRNAPSGTDICEIDSKSLALYQRENEHYAVIGKIANSDADATIINRNFGKWESGGYGEARHMAIFGRNGSGKSVIVLVFLVAKLAAHPEMGLLIPDTQGDFADPTKHSRGEFKWNYVEALESAPKMGYRSVEVIDIEDISLKSVDLLKDLLKKVIFEVYSTDPEHASQLSGYVVNSMFDKEVDSKRLTAKVVADAMVQYIEQAYAKASRAAKKEDAERVRDDPGRFRELEWRIEHRVRPFFTGKEPIDKIVNEVLRDGRKVIISMQRPESEQQLVMQELMHMLKSKAQQMYKSGKTTANAIVVLDEAPRWLPEGSSSPIKEVVLQALRETRKAGVGWWVVGQSPANVAKDVLKQAHMVWFGRGLGVGVDLEHVKNALQPAGFQAYMDMQRRPGRYFWVGIGLDNNIGHDNTHVVVEPFDGDATQKLMDANSHIWGDELEKPKGDDEWFDDLGSEDD